MMAERSLNRHQCYSKCSKSAPCTGDDCYCDGLYAGYDDDKSTALCLTEARCQQECTALGNCIGVDMHNSKNRCFLNFAAETPFPDTSCERQVMDQTLAPYDDYTFFYKRSTARRLSPSRGLLEVVDTGSSWNEMLRFRDVRVPTGGYFKACFCDT